MISGPRIRTTAGLWIRAALVAAILLPLVGVLLVVGVLTGLLLGMILVGFVGYVVDPPLPVVAALLVAGVLIALVGGVSAVRAEVRAGRDRLLELATPVRDPDGDYGWFVRTVGRLAAQADVPVPDTRVHLSATPLAYTVRNGGAPTVVVSVGLLDALSTTEAEAVLAHEVAHVANRDLRWTGRAMLPLLGAEEFHETFVDEGDSDPRDIPYRLLGRALIAWGELGLGVFSRGRELAADRAAALLTGDPGALAVALDRLDESTAEASTADLRSVDALNVLPTLPPDGRFRASHPPTEARIERLQTLEREYETR